MADRTELLELMKHGVQEKWQKIYMSSTKADNIQEVIIEVGKLQPSITYRKVKTSINQFITGQVGLNYLISKIDRTKSTLFENYSEKETI